MAFEEVWQEEALHENAWHKNALANSNQVKIATMVCFVSDPENQQIIKETLLTLDQQTKVIFISQGPYFEKQSPERYRISRTDRETYVKAFRSLREDTGADEVDAILYLWALEDSSCIEDCSGIVYLLQGLAAVKLKAKRVLMGAQSGNGLERCYLESWIGFERSLGLILPNTQVAAVYQAAAQETGTVVMVDWLRHLWEELQQTTPKARSVFYQNGKRHVYRVRPTNLTTGTGNAGTRKDLVKPGGTYLITGGCGGLGLLFAGYLARKQPVQLILSGRSPLDAGKLLKMKALEDMGCKVMYLQADVSDLAGMRDGLNRLKERFGKINGVIHAAGLTGSGTIFAKDFNSFQQVLDPKIKGTLVLDELLHEEALDFICYFASAAAIIGDFGSCDYAVANRFLMAYAHYRNQRQQKGELTGKAVTINWPLWKEGGMGFGDDENTRMYLKSSGQRLLETEEGLNLFDRILAQNGSQYLIVAGQPSRVHRFLGLSKEQPLIASPGISGATGGTLGQTRRRRPEMRGMTVAQCLEWDLKEQISRLLKISRDKLDRDANLADFGFDSISLTQLAKLLTDHYHIELTPVLFFGYATLEKLIQYFLTEHSVVIKEFYREEVEGFELTAPVGSPKIPDENPVRRLRPQRSRFVIGVTAAIPEPIAIIGMSGRFPGARNTDELWTILVTGQDLVREIPPERFDWRQFYSTSNEPGKTNCKWCGCIPGMREFEPLFFGISPKEAETMDPRQRLLLQEAWEALEDAGYGAKQIQNNKIGMFVGVEQGDYQYLTNGEGGITSNHNAILASRLAYFLNLNGPVMAIDTACSSGLVAAHQAILSLRAGECDTAIAAGANLILTPESLIGMSQAGMLSEDGKCYAFDKRANGLVPGEAVAVVVLKRLSRAEADGDPVYAVIKGSGINYDGKTNGITAPSGVSQTALLKTVYDQYRVNPEEIELIITHGTGTKLGDPVEINALYDAFKGYRSHASTSKQGYCALTSTKTNFGHTFAASGLVSLISLVQALRHETIPASLHCEQENDHINWKESPFYVNKTNQPWPDAASGTFGKGRTRTGAVSAFGMSGTNVHLVVQSYSVVEEVPRQQMLLDQAPYSLLAFSAKTAESLREKIKDLMVVLENKVTPELNLSQISYTLLEGRQHFNYRFAVVIRDREDAIYVLKQANSREKLPNLFYGKVAHDFTGQKAIEQYAQDLLKQSWALRENKVKYQEMLFALADLYCQGYELDWKQLYGDAKPQRIHLPTYPFVKECYWVPEIDSKFGRITSSSAMAAFIHPLLHQNTSDLSEQRFSSTFTGEEFFFADHLMQGRRVLPGVACLEMARAAVESATKTMRFVAGAAGSLVEGRVGIRLQNVVWGRPIIAGEQPVPVRISLYPEDNNSACFEGEIAYEISSESVNKTEPVIYNQGSAILTPVTDLPVLDLKAMQARCNQNSLSAMEVYETFKTMGIDYNPVYQGIAAVWVGQDQVLAKLSLSASVLDTNDQFVLHPGIMDSAIQASFGLMMQASDLRPGNLTLSKSILPGALQEIEIFGKGTYPTWALIRSSEGVGPVTLEAAGQDDVCARMRELLKVDIDLCDEQGTIWARVRGLEVQANPGIMINETSHLSQNVALEAVNSQEDYELMTFEEVWEPDADIRVISPVKPKVLVCFLSNPENQQLFIETMRTYDQQAHAGVQIIFISQSTTAQKEATPRARESAPTRNYRIAGADRHSYHEVFQSIRQEFAEIDAILYLWPLEDAGCLRDYSRIVHLLQTVDSTKLKVKRILLTAQYENELDRCYPESWIGFERSLGLVLPSTQVATIYQAAQTLNRETIKDWARKIYLELQTSKAQSVFYQDEKRYICRIRPTSLPSAKPTEKSLIKPGGTYLITGGCGGLGLLFAGHLAKRSKATKPVKLILTGRSPLDAVKQSKIKALEDSGSQVIYIQADVCDPIEMKTELNKAKESFGSVNGVIHAAGITGSQSIFTKELQSFQRVIYPKITGTLVLDELLAAEPLDFVCYFSSSAAILGDFGSCDYAVANRFLMAHAHCRNQQRNNGERYGKTIAINWPLWKDGGMGFGDDANTRMYLKSSGQRILEAEEGLEVFDRISDPN